MTARRPTLTIPQMIDRNNREVRNRRLNRALGHAIAALCCGGAMALTGALLAIILFERFF